MGMVFHKDCVHFRCDCGRICRIYNVSGFETGVEILRLLMTVTAWDTSSAIYEENSESLRGLNRKSHYHCLKRHRLTDPLCTLKFFLIILVSL